VSLWPIVGKGVGCDESENWCLDRIPTKSSIFFDFLIVEAKPLLI